jgi:hypothetical protein
LGISDNVEFHTDVPNTELTDRWRARSLIGLHSMRDEHFGIGVVELMASGVITIAHRSGGPQSDIVQPAVSVSEHQSFNDIATSMETKIASPSSSTITSPITPSPSTQPTATSITTPTIVSDGDVISPPPQLPPLSTASEVPVVASSGFLAETIDEYEAAMITILRLHALRLLDDTHTNVASLLLRRLQDNGRHSTERFSDNAFNDAINHLITTLIVPRLARNASKLKPKSS